MCRCQVSRAAFGSARSALGTEVARGQTPDSQAFRQFWGDNQRAPVALGDKPFRKKKNQSTMQESLTRSVLTRCVAESQSQQIFEEFGVGPLLSFFSSNRFAEEI